MKQSEIDGTETKDISITFPSGPARQFPGQSLLLGHSLPNFYFHATTSPGGKGWCRCAVLNPNGGITSGGHSELSNSPSANVSLKTTQAAASPRSPRSAVLK